MPRGMWFPLAISGSTLGSRPTWMCLQREVLRGYHNQMSEPPQLAPFDTKEQQLSSELPPDVQPSNPISKAEPSLPVKEPGKSKTLPFGSASYHNSPA